MLGGGLVRTCAFLLALLYPGAVVGTQEHVITCQIRERVNDGTFDGEAKDHPVKKSCDMASALAPVVVSELMAVVSTLVSGFDFDVVENAAMEVLAMVLAGQTMCNCDFGVMAGGTTKKAKASVKAKAGAKVKAGAKSKAGANAKASVKAKKRAQASSTTAKGELLVEPSAPTADVAPVTVTAVASTNEPGAIQDVNPADADMAQLDSNINPLDQANTATIVTETAHLTPDESLSSSQVVTDSNQKEPPASSMAKQSASMQSLVATLTDPQILLQLSQLTLPLLNTSSVLPAEHHPDNALSWLLQAPAFTPPSQLLAMATSVATGEVVGACKHREEITDKDKVLERCELGAELGPLIVDQILSITASLVNGFDFDKVRMAANMVLSSALAGQGLCDCELKSAPAPSATSMLSSEQAEEVGEEVGDEVGDEVGQDDRSAEASLESTLPEPVGFFVKPDLVQPQPKAAEPAAMA